MNLSQARVRLVQAGAVLAAAALVAGCGNSYRPSVTPVNPSGPPSSASSTAVVVSSPSRTKPGIATIIDYSGDTVMDYQPIGIGPINFSLDSNGSYGYTFNSDHTLTEFPANKNFQEKDILFSTLPSTAQPLNMFTPTSNLWAADLTGNQVDVFTGGPQTLQTTVPLAPTPVMVIGPDSVNQRYYGISQGITGATGVECNASPAAVAVNGQADGIIVGTYTISSRIPLGKCPVYAVESTDSRRVFVMNRGSDTITVIDTQRDTLDTCTPFLNQAGQPVTCHPTLPLSTTAVAATGITPVNGTTGMSALAGPVYAEYNALKSELIVSNYDGSTVSVIDVSLDEFGNDSPTFGTTFTIPVGSNPASVTVLVDGTRAYTANQTDETVSIVNLSSHTVIKTLAVTGHPRTVVSTQNSTQGKVYVASTDSNVLTIIRTDLDIVGATVPVQGNIVDVRTTTQNGAGGNWNDVSRTPGFGQPCNLPGAASTASIADCQALPAQ